MFLDVKFCYSFMCSAISRGKRTPLTRAFKGWSRQRPARRPSLCCFKGVIEASGIDPKLIEDIYVGNVLPPKGGATNM